MKKLPKADQKQQVVELTCKDVGLSVSTKPDYGEFLNELTKAIQYLIDTDFEKLMHILYRIDVSESKVKKTFGLEKEVAREIALLVLEREKQKVITRELYK